MNNELSKLSENVSNVKENSHSGSDHLEMYTD